MTAAGWRIIITEVSTVYPCNMNKLYPIKQWTSVLLWFLSLLPNIPTICSLQKHSSLIFILFDSSSHPKRISRWCVYIYSHCHVYHFLKHKYSTVLWENATEERAHKWLPSSLFSAKLSKQSMTKNLVLFCFGELVAWFQYEWTLWCWYLDSFSWAPLKKPYCYKHLLTSHIPWLTWLFLKLSDE